MTEFIYCEKCAAVMREELAKLNVPGTHRGLAEMKTDRIVAGYIGNYIHD